MTTTKELSNNTVLIIDDTPDNLAILSDTLSEAGYRVLVAVDGSSALAQNRFLKAGHHFIGHYDAGHGRL
jgi:CheY-like chemotaxis protein